jgi:hypothetical protein
MLILLFFFLSFFLLSSSFFIFCPFFRAIALGKKDGSQPRLMHTSAQL